MNPTKESVEREAYIAPTVTDIAPITVVNGQEEDEDGEERLSGEPEEWEVD